MMSMASALCGFFLFLSHASGTMTRSSGGISSLVKRVPGTAFALAPQNVATYTTSLVDAQVELRTLLARMSVLEARVQQQQQQQQQRQQKQQQQQQQSLMPSRGGGGGGGGGEQSNLVSSSSPFYSSTFSSGAFALSSLASAKKTNDLSAREIAISASISFFFVGVLLAMSITEQWVVSCILGVVCAWWSSVEINRDTRLGALTRSIGLQTATWKSEARSFWDRAVIYYETYKLGLEWNKIDKRFGIEKKFDELKKLAMLRASELKNLNQEDKIKITFADVLTVLRSSPNEVKKFDGRYKLSATVGDFSRGLVSLGKEALRNATRRPTASERRAKQRQKQQRDKNKQKASSSSLAIDFWYAPATLSP